MKIHLVTNFSAERNLQCSVELELELTSKLTKMPWGLKWKENVPVNQQSSSSSFQHEKYWTTESTLGFIDDWETVSYSSFSHY